MSKLIKKLWNIAWGMWEQCNDILHHSPDSQINIVESLLNYCIWQIYALGSALLLHDALWMMQTLLDQLQKPLTTKQQWVESIDAATAQKLWHDHGAMAGEQ